MMSVYYDYNSFELTEESKTKLDQFVDSLGSTKEYIIELQSSTDSIAPNDYNKRLARKRGQSVKTYLAESDLKIKAIDIIPFGEENPKYSNGDSIGRSFNRRTDIIIFPVDSGTITLVGPGGTEITVSVDYFSPCSICEAKPKVIEILTDEQAAEQGIPMLTDDGRELVTGGMVKLDFDCPKPLDNNCLPATIKFPVQPNNGVPDSLMVQWESVPTENGMRWRANGKPCKPIGDILITRVDCFQKEAQLIPKFNCDVPKCKATIYTPSLKRKPFLDDNIKNQIRRDTTTIKSIGICIDSSFKVYDIGIGQEGQILSYIGSVIEFKSDDGSFKIPLSAYTRSYRTRISLPNLIRKDKPKIESKGNTAVYEIWGNHIDIDSNTHIYGDIIDEGFDTNDIKYSVNTHLHDFEDRTCPETFSRHYLIPIGAYHKTLFYHDSIYVIKSPKRLVGNTELLITPIDSSLTIDKYKGKSNVAQFKMPKHPTDLLLTLKNPKNSKSTITLSPDSDVIRRKYKKKKRYYKLKIRKGKLRKSLKNK